uniref:Uncharacterized protein n=1 Tax=Micrurus surinamensis TaxID=129470 RepID=A0A2D4P023_MICSU
MEGQSGSRETKRMAIRALWKTENNKQHWEKKQSQPEIKIFSISFRKPQNSSPFPEVERQRRKLRGDFKQEKVDYEKLKNMLHDSSREIILHSEKGVTLEVSREKGLLASHIGQTVMQAWSCEEENKWN